MKFNASLTTKIMVLLAIPIAAVVVLSGNLIYENWNARQAAVRIAANAKMMELIGSTIKETRVERVESRLFLTGSLSASQLGVFRSATESRLEELKTEAASYWGGKTYVENIAALKQGYDRVRKEVDNKADPSEVRTKYIGFIDAMMEMQTQIALSQASDLRPYLVSQAILEQAAENAGLLRAHLSGVISAGKKIDPATENKGTTLYSKIIASIESKAVVLSSEGQIALGKFTDLSAWRKVQAALDAVTKNSETGEYGLSAEAVLADTSATVDYLSKLISSENAYVEHQAEAVKARASWLFVLTLICSMGGSAVLVVFASLFLKRLSADLGRIAGELSENTNQVSSAANQVADASSELSSSTNEQAAALQETVSSIDQVSAMVGKNADNAKKSQDISSVSHETAQKGKQVVTDMIHAIEEINHANVAIMQQMQTSNQEISNIVTLINEIGTKTKVINDIVFQTKLLSFNASVEAARAGEHGKGFAVVAEEVGNLAQMSGNAAKEISQMLDDSINKVEKIVVENRTQVESLVASGKEKVDFGAKTARRCGEVLDEIVGNVSQVNHMVAEIATASQEQSTGVNEITKAMNQMDQVTQQNATASQQAASAAEQLRSQAIQLGESTRQLLAVVRGEAESIVGNSAKPVKAKKAYRAEKAPAAEKGLNAAPAAPVPAAEPLSAKVLPFPVKAAEKSSSVKAEYKQVAGGGTPVPSQDDDRFEEV